jgi:hypothetical protein
LPKVFCGKLTNFEKVIADNWKPLCFLPNIIISTNHIKDNSGYEKNTTILFCDPVIILAHTVSFSTHIQSAKEISKRHSRADQSIWKGIGRKP